MVLPAASSATVQGRHTTSCPEILSRCRAGTRRNSAPMKGAIAGAERGGQGLLVLVSPSGVVTRLPEPPSPARDAARSLLMTRLRNPPPREAPGGPLAGHSNQ